MLTIKPTYFPDRLKTLLTEWDWSANKASKLLRFNVFAAAFITVFMGEGFYAFSFNTIYIARVTYLNHTSHPEPLNEEQ